MPKLMYGMFVKGYLPLTIIGSMITMCVDFLIDALSPAHAPQKGGGCFRQMYLTCFPSASKIATWSNSRKIAQDCR
jgi:hypothetical protein